MNDAATLADYEWLTSPASARYLAEAAAGAATVQLAARLRRDLSPERVHLVLEQAELRERAKVKFAAADRMFFTRKGLEQASGEAIAEYKARRFPAGELIFDLCCGIGGDMLSFSRRGPAVGVERDAAVAHLARANLAACGLIDWLIVAEDAASHAPYLRFPWHIDPDRRPSGKRTTDPELHEPSLAEIERFFVGSPQAAIKLAPAAEVPDSWQREKEREWLGWRGECRQQVIWNDELARYPGLRVATVITPGNISTVVEAPSARLALAATPARYFYEAHAAVLAAGLAASLGFRNELLDLNHIGYLTADHLVLDPLLAAFEVLDHLPFDRKTLAAWCRVRDIGILEVKVRGLDLVPDRVRRELHLPPGRESATVLIWRNPSGTWATLARRVGQASDRL